MNSLIKRSDALRILCGTCRAEEACVEGLVGNCEAFKAIVDLDPVQETKRGEWVEDGFLNRKTCSICGAWIADNTGTAKLNFCPNCGADNRGENNG